MGRLLSCQEVTQYFATYLLTKDDIIRVMKDRGYYDSLLSEDSASLTEPQLVSKVNCFLKASKDLNNENHDEESHAKETQPEILLDAKNQAHRLILFYGGTFVWAFFSAMVYWYAAEKASKRYSDLFPALKTFLTLVPPPASLLTNLMFNWISLIDLWEKEKDPVSAIIKYIASFHENAQEKIIAIISSIATILPFFSVGFEGSQFQKALVAIAAILSLPVFYLGSLDFYKFFHAPFVQRIRWLLRCSPEKYVLATEKSYLVDQLKTRYQYYCHADKKTRAQFISDFKACQPNLEKIAFLLSDDKQFDYLAAKNAFGFWSKLRFLFSSGLGLMGLVVITQNYGHVVGTITGILAWNLPKVVDIFLIIVLAAGNLIPGLGFSLSGMANFDLIKLVRKMMFYDVPQVQKIIMGEFPSKENCFFPALSFLSAIVIFSILRGLYIASGFSNDEVNYESAKASLVSEFLSTIFGFLCGFCGAIVFNGVPCENLFLKLMEDRVTSIGDSEDQEQVEFEAEYRDFIDTWETAPLEEFRRFRNYSDSVGSDFFRFNSDEQNSQANKYLPVSSV